MSLPTGGSEPGPAEGISIRLINGTVAEQRTREQLRALLNRCDLRPWQFTDAVAIDEMTSLPHSHPVLTLDTGYQNEDLLLLATYLHEQLHWFIWQQPDERMEPAIAALISRYPEVPIGYPRGSEDALGSYFHYLVCYLEYLSVRAVAGEDAARHVMAVWMGHHYTEIYRTVMEDTDAIAEIAVRHDLLPAILRQEE